MGFFYNPNIHPTEECQRRLEELVLLAEQRNFKVFVKQETPEIWLEAVKGYENEPERGSRCAICFKLRLEETAKFAVQNGFDLFTTTLTISPHKNSQIINKIGKELESKYGIRFLEENFKKQDGFKKSLELSQKYNLYRQEYCGCKFSVRNSK
ncbi:MAG: epoxyqueuosine reductase QueH [Desulfobacterales bacterium]|nr:epoxyqueuosine reductase QueH [Desulfobacterales bacterium]